MNALMGAGTDAPLSRSHGVFYYGTNDRDVELHVVCVASQSRGCSGVSNNCKRAQRDPTDVAYIYCDGS